MSPKDFSFDLTVFPRAIEFLPRVRETGDGDEIEIGREGGREREGGGGGET